VDLLWDPALPNSTRSRVDGRDVPLLRLVEHLGVLYVRTEKEGRRLRATLRLERGVPAGEIARIAGALNGVSYGPIDVECRPAKKTAAAPSVELPSTFAGRPIPEDRERIEVTVTGNGEVWFFDRRVTLRELLEEFEKANPEAAPSTRTLLIRASRHARWRHIQWILMCGAKAGFYKVAYALQKDQGPVMLQVPLSRDAGIEMGRDGEDQILGLTLRGKELGGFTTEFLFEIEVVGRAREMPAYRWLKTETSDVARLEMELKRSLRIIKGGEGRRKAELRVDPATAFGYVAALMDSCVRIGMDMVHLRGTPRITEEIARAERLPFETTR
jgi:biopolymer transport protein ExbD